MAWVTNQIITVNGQTVLKLALAEYYDQQHLYAGPPKHGLDGFLFGIRQSPADRKMVATVEQFRKDLPNRLNEAMQRANLTGPDSADTAAAAAAIADAVNFLLPKSQAHDAFKVTTDAGRGVESIGRLGRNFGVCDRPPHLMYKAVPTTGSCKEASSLA